MQTKIQNDIAQHVSYRKKLAEIKDKQPKYPPAEYIRPEYINKVVFRLNKFNK